MLSLGAAIGYSDDKAFLTRGAVLRLGPSIEAPLSCLHAGGIEVFVPTIMLGSPKIWGMLKKEAEAEIGL